MGLEANVVAAGADNVAEELVGVLLTAPLEVLSEVGEALVNLGRRVERPIKAEGSSDLPLEDAEGALLLSILERRLSYKLTPDRFLIFLPRNRARNQEKKGSRR